MHTHSTAAPDPGQAIPSSPSIRIGSRRVRFMSAGGRGLEHHFFAVWSPSPPRRWKPDQLARYRKARDDFMAELDAAFGCKPILLDKMDLEGVSGLVRAAAVMTAAKSAGVTVTPDGLHGARELLDVWGPVLAQHAEALALLVAATPGGAR